MFGLPTKRSSIFGQNKRHDWFKQWHQHTSWHGIPDLFRTDVKVCKFLWIIVLLVTTVMFTVTVYSHVSDYNNGDTWIRRTYYKRNEYGYIPFPTVVVCSFNKVSKRKIDKVNVSLKAAAYIIDSITPWSGLEMIAGTALFKEMENDYLTSAEIYGNLSVVQWLEHISPGCEDIIIDCYYNEQFFDCCKFAPKPLYMPGRGICYPLQMPDIFNLTRMDPGTPAKGVDSGWHLELNGDSDDYAPVMKIDNPNNGFMILATYNPEYSPYLTPVVVGTGTRTYISMIAERSSIRLPLEQIPFLHPMHIPHPNCKENGKLHYLEGEYFHETCIADCQAQNVRRHCGCNFFGPLKPEYNICDPYTVFQCRSTINNTDAQLQKCINRCIAPCEKTKLDNKATVIFWSSAMQFPNHNTVGPFLDLIEYYTNIEASTSNDNETVIVNRRYIKAMRHGGHQVAAVSLFFESTKVRIVEKVERYTIETLISNVGGALGLWAGISIITLYQAVVYLFTAIVERLVVKKEEIHDNNCNEKLMPEQLDDVNLGQR